MDQLPPWLQISPRDYLLATQAGAQLGNTIAEQTQKAWEEQQRLRMESQTQQNVAQQHAVENAMTRLAADRLEQYRQTEAAHRNQELGIQQQGLGIRQGEIANANRRADIYNAAVTEKAIHDAAREKTLDAAEARRQQYAQGGDLRDLERQMRLAQSGLDVAKKNVDKLSATKTSVSSGVPLIGSTSIGQYLGMGPSTNQVPVFKQADKDKAKAALDAAQNSLDEKKSLLDSYKKSKGPSSVVTHVYDPASGTYNPVQPDDDGSGD